MTPKRTARHDPALKARIVQRIPLLYDDDPDPDHERLPYVRAGSSLTPVHDKLVVVQDNANYLAVIDLATGRARSLALPPGPRGDRIFDHDHGNVEHKLDLEACVSIPGERDTLLVAFGSGSQPERERIVVVRWPADAEPEASVYDGAAFYAVLRQQHAFSGRALNVEGAIFLGDDRIRLFERGNGAPRDGRDPVDATGDLRWSELWEHLRDPTQAPPRLSNITQYQLGTLDGHPLNFSDADAVGNVVLFSASAEETAGAGTDGAIGGSVLGVIDAAGARWTRLTSDQQDNFREKIEGLSVGKGNPYRVYFVVDDDRDEPSALFEVELAGPWYGSDDGS